MSLKMKILLLGKDGQVGWELQRSLVSLGELISLGRVEADFLNLESLKACIRKHQPNVIVNAAAYTAVDKAESEMDKAELVNSKAVELLAEEANKLNAWLIHYSTDYVFNGEKENPYLESDVTDPLSVYGATKLGGEKAIIKGHDRYLIFRTSWVFAARGGNFAKTMLRLAADRESLNVVGDQFGAPTSAELIADVTAIALRQIVDSNDPNFSGIYNLAASGETSWHGYAKFVIGLAQSKGLELKMGPDLVNAIATEAYPLPAKRPRNSRLNTTKIRQAFHINLPDWRYHVERMITELIA